MTDKAEESTVGPEKQMKRHRELLTSPLCKSRLTRGLLSVMPEEEAAFQAGGSAVSLEDGEDACAPLPFLTCPSAAWPLAPPCQGAVRSRSPALGDAALNFSATLGTGVPALLLGNLPGFPSSPLDWFPSFFW